MERAVDRIVDVLADAGARDISSTKQRGLEELYFKGLSPRGARKALKNAGYFENPSGGFESRDGGPILVIGKSGTSSETEIDIYSRRKYKRDVLQGRNTVRNKMESREKIDDLLEQNMHLKSLLRKSGMALALTEQLNRVPSSLKQEAVSRLQESGSFKSVTRFAEHAKFVADEVLNESQQQPKHVQESAPQPVSNDKAVDMSESDPLGLFHSDFVLARKIIGSNGRVNEAFGLDEWIKQKYGRGPLRELYSMWSTKQALPKKKLQEASDDIESLKESVEKGTLKNAFSDTAKNFLSYVSSQKGKFRI